jgi:hypothetical protein
VRNSDANGDGHGDAGAYGAAYSNAAVSPNTASAPVTVISES